MKSHKPVASWSINKGAKLVRALATFFLTGIVLSSLLGCQPAPHKSKWGFIDTSGKLVIPCRFDEVATDNHTGFAAPNYNFYLGTPFHNFNEGLCAVRMGNKWGYINKAGEMVIPAQYSGAGTFSEGLACVRQADKIGYIDRSGKIAIPITIDWIPQLRTTSQATTDDEGHDSQADLANLQKKNEAANRMIDCCQFSEGLAVAFAGDKCGYIDSSGKFAIEATYDMCSQFHDGMAAVVQGTKTYRLNKAGIAIKKLPATTQFYGDGLFVNEIDNKRYEFVDVSGKRIIAQEFGAAHAFSESLAAVAPKTITHVDGGIWGYIDTAGKMVIPPKFFIGSNNLSCSFVDGKAVAAELTGKHLCGIIDRKGKWVVQPQYRLIGAYRDGFAWALKETGVVYLDYLGREAIDPHTNETNSFSGGLAAVKG